VDTGFRQYDQAPSFQQKLESIFLSKKMDTCLRRYDENRGETKHAVIPAKAGIHHSLKIKYGYLLAQV